MASFCCRHSTWAFSQLSGRPMCRAQTGSVPARTPGFGFWNQNRENIESKCMFSFQLPKLQKCPSLWTISPAKDELSSGKLNKKTWPWKNIDTSDSLLMEFEEDIFTQILDPYRSVSILIREECYRNRRLRSSSNLNNQRRLATVT